MAKRTGTTNQELAELICELKKLSIEKNIPLFKRLAKELSKATRSRRAVNISRINRFGKEGETLIVPGKVLGSGELDKKLKVVAWQFSEKAMEKLEASGSVTADIAEFIKTDIKGQKVRIIG